MAEEMKMAEPLTEEEVKAKKKEDAYANFMKDFMQGYYDTKRDEDGMADFVKLLNLGCFGKEFCVYGMAYEDEHGPAYRASGKALNLFEFAKYCGIEGIYPTAVFTSLQRRISPAGTEDMIKNLLKKETAEEMKKLYNADYFAAMHTLGKIGANNEAYDLLNDMRDYLDGRYVESEIDLFEGLLLEAVNDKLLTANAYMEFADWLKDVRKQLENDIKSKGRYEKVMSGFSYRDEKGNIKHFTDAFLQTSYETREEYELKGYQVSPLYVKKYWTREASEFIKVRKEFEQHMKECFDEHYWKLLDEMKAMPSAIPVEVYEAQKQIVKEHCSEVAYQNVVRYGRRWNVEK